MPPTRSAPKRHPFASRAEGGINRWKDSVARSLRAHATRTRCPGCARKSALRDVAAEGEPAIYVCRWCGWEGTAQDRTASKDAANAKRQDPDAENAAEEAAP